jgi:molybdate transport system substrate-binding protein
MNKRANIIKQLFFAATLVTAMMLTACDRKDPKQEQSAGKELILYCAAGIRPPVAELIEIFKREHGVEIFTDYAGSEVLLSKIKLSHSGDLYIPGDKHYIEQAVREDMILSRRSIFYWIPTILVSKGNPKKISGLKDILRTGLKLGLGDPNACAIGRTSRQILANNNITWEEVKKHVSYLSLTVNELGMQIQAKSLDAVIVWDATAQYYGDYGDEVPIALEKNLISTVDIGVLKFTKNRELAEKFVDFITSERGQEVFEKHNYSTKPPE